LHGVSQGAVAEFAGFSTSTISRLEVDPGAFTIEHASKFIAAVERAANRGADAR
jgi:hypothetical protein